MPMRLEYTFGGDAFADGAGGDKFLIDLSENLSQMYGRLIRQGQVFRVRSVSARIKNPNTLVQDQAMAVSGKLVYYHPTSNRKKAWANAFKTWLANRQALGVKARGADFRVGISDGYSTDVGALNDGVKYNAWINDEEQPLMLNSATDEQDIFGVYNQNVVTASPDSTNANFGHWAQKDAQTIGDDLDFVTNQSSYYDLRAASETAQTVPFQLNFSAWFDDAQADPSDFASASNSEYMRGPFDVMCGLIGVYVDTTTVDDSETQTQDWSLEISVEVESWSPMIKSRSRNKSKGAKN